MITRQERRQDLRRAALHLLREVRRKGKPVKATEARQILATVVQRTNRREDAWLLVLDTNALAEIGKGYYILTKDGERWLRILEDEFVE